MQSMDQGTIYLSFFKE